MLQDLPAEIFQLTLDQVVLSVGLYESLRLRSVSNAFHAGITRTIWSTRLLENRSNEDYANWTPSNDMTKEYLFNRVTTDQFRHGMFANYIYQLVKCVNFEPELQRANVGALCVALIDENGMRSAISVLNKKPKAINIHAEIAAAACVNNTIILRAHSDIFFPTQARRSILGEPLSNAVRNHNFEAFELIFHKAFSTEKLPPRYFQKGVWKDQVCSKIRNQLCRAFGEAVRTQFVEVVDFYLAREEMVSMIKRWEYEKGHGFGHFVTIATQSNDPLLITRLLETVFTHLPPEETWRRIASEAAYVGHFDLFRAAMDICGHDIGPEECYEAELNIKMQMFQLINIENLEFNIYYTTGHLDIAQGVDYEEVDYEGVPYEGVAYDGYENILCAGARRGFLEFVQFAISISPKPSNEEMDELIIYAAMNGHSGVLQCLLGHGGDVSGIKGSEALAEAALRGYETVVRSLIAHGADPNGEENEPLRLANLYEQEHVANALIELGAQEVHFEFSEDKKKMRGSHCGIQAMKG